MEKIEENIINTLSYLFPNYTGEKILVAVSGGIDSLVCAHILNKHNYAITIAHCNFQLRKEESDLDAAFVKKWASKNKKPYLEKKFTFKKSKGKSIQMIARDMRYQWFYEIADNENFAYIVTAHHLNDSIETSLMNIIRGTGIAGLTGIPVINGKVIRPMITVLKSEIEAYAQKEKITWRQDQTNLTTKYKRNKIRHELIPLLLKFNPNFFEVYANNINNWQNISKIYKQAVARLKIDMVHFDEAIMGFKISILELMGKSISNEILFELISEFGFNTDQANNVYEAIYNQAGKKFHSPEHVLLIDRLFIIIKPIANALPLPDNYIIEKNKSFENDEWEIDYIEPKQLKTMQTGKNELLLDNEKLTWPICIRKWKAGDKFTPMGMKGKKKISDFLTDKKIDLFEKEDTWIIESSKGKIAGIVGLRPDENYKISSNTKLCICIKRKNNN